MSLRTQILATALILLPAAGCLPKKRVVWSPDGSRAAVITDQCLYFIDGAGKPLPHRWKSHIEDCDWFPDGSRIVIAHSRKAKGWEEIRGFLPSEQIAKIEAFAREAKPQILAYQGDWDDFEFSPKGSLPTSMEIAAVIYLRDRLPEGLAEKMGDKWTDVEQLEIDLDRLQIFELSDSKLRPDRILVQSIETIDRPRVSPDGRHVAFLTSPWQEWEEGRESPALFVVPAHGEKARLVGRNVAIDYDWSPDGRSLAFIRGVAPESEDDDTLQLGALTTMRVASEAGDLLDEATEQLDRAGLLFSRGSAVRWLRSGALVFSSAELNLPSTSSDMPQRWTLFRLDPKMPASIHRVVGRDFDEPLDTSLAFFELSPDESKVLLPGPGGRVTLYEFASGRTTGLIEAPDATDKTRGLASWRNNDEICFIVPGEKQGKTRKSAEVALWRETKVTVLSRDWPDEMKEGWLLDE